MVALSEIGKAAKKQEKQRNRAAGYGIAATSGAAVGGVAGKGWGEEIARNKGAAYARGQGASYGNFRAGEHPHLGNPKYQSSTYWPKDPPKREWSGGNVRHADPRKQKRAESVAEMYRRGATPGEKEAAAGRLRAMGIDPKTAEGHWRETPGGPKQPRNSWERAEWTHRARRQAQGAYDTDRGAWKATSYKYARMGEEKVLSDIGRMGARKGAAVGAGIGAAAGAGAYGLGHLRQNQQAKARRRRRR